MAIDYEWGPDHPLVRATLAHARDFEFFQLLHLIERLVPDAIAIGGSGPASREPVRLRPALSLAFPVADIDASEWRDALLTTGGFVTITTTFLGLYGTKSPLAAHFTEMLLPEREGEVRLREFLDLFHHRLLSLLYRVWKKYRYFVTFRADGRDPISMVVRGLLGIGTPHIDDELGVPPTVLFRYAGLLSQRPRSASGLAGQLQDYFGGIPFDLEQCVGRWVWIEDGQRNRLGDAKCNLGMDFLLGERIYDCSGKIRVEIGPVGLDDYCRFLPEAEAADDLRKVLRFYCTDPVEYDVRVTLRGEEVPQTRLGVDGPAGRLAGTTWLLSAPSADKSAVFQGAGN